MRIISTSSEIQCHHWLEGTLYDSYKPSSNTSTHINTVSWAKDGGWVVLVPNQGNAEIVSFNNTAKLLHTIQEVQHPTSACFQNSTKRNIAIGTASGQLMIYDIKRREVKKKFPYAPSAFFKIQYTNRDNYIVAGCENGEIYIYNNVTSTLSGSFKVSNSRTLTNFRCHPTKRNYICACSEEGIVSLWDLNKSKSLVHMEVHKSLANDLTFTSSNFELIASLGMDRRVCLYDFRVNKIVHEFNLGKTPTALDSNSDGNNIAIGFQDGQIISYDLRNLNQSVYKFSHPAKINNIMFEKNGADNASVISLPEDAKTDEVVEVDTDKKANYESFGQMLYEQVLPGISEIENEKNANEIKDSFLDAIGFNSESLTDSAHKHISALGITDGVKKLMDSRPDLFQASPSTHYFHNSQTVSETDDQKPEMKWHVESAINKSQLASTPVPASGKDFPAFHISPIPTNTKKGDCAELTNICLKDIMKEVIREEMEEFKKEIKYQIMDVMTATRRHFLDLQMSLVKEFISVEENLEKFRKELACAETSDSGYDGT